MRRIEALARDTFELLYSHVSPLKRPPPAAQRSEKCGPLKSTDPAGDLLQQIWSLDMRQTSKWMHETPAVSSVTEWHCSNHAA